MKYYSTRGGGPVAASQAVLSGIAPDGGLYLPDEIPALPEGFLAALAGMPYAERASAVLALFFPEFSQGELEKLCGESYGAQFEDGLPAPLAAIGRSRFLLELWHGPTCAFKDIALQLLPRLLPACARRQGCAKELLVLTATSGDTGKAALEGFRDVPGVRVAVFYPENGVSAMQRRQMVTQQGKNVAVCGVRGSFDDAQAAVKALFTDPAVLARLDRAGFAFSSANSINWGRLAPQIVYYLGACADLLAAGELAPGETLDVCVPTGNFGNLLAAWYAKKMGAPLGRLICASNENNVLSDFLSTGVYDRNRAFHTTISPSMDILVSSNLERLLWTLEDRDPSRIRAMMAQLRDSGRFAIGSGAFAALRRDFVGGWAGGAEAGREIRELFADRSYLCDPHTAVALGVLDALRRREGGEQKTLVCSTASPFKFAPAVLSALGEQVSGDDFADVGRLSALSGAPVPGPIEALRDAPERFTQAREPARLGDFLEDFLAM